MYRYHVSVIAACIIGIAAISCVPAQNVTSDTENDLHKWEYKALLLTDVVDAKQEPSEQVAAIELRLNKLGQDGWELSEQLTRVLILKRPKR